MAISIIGGELEIRGTLVRELSQPQKKHRKRCDVINLATRFKPQATDEDETVGRFALARSL